jgi:short-subunit dehydrogenase
MRFAVRQAGVMTTWTRALVTGASSGIGRAIARQLAAEGTALVVVARDETRLRALADSVEVECEVLVADLADLSALKQVEQRLADRSAPIDLLVNNAGFGFQGSFHELDMDRESAVVDVNITAVHRLARVAAAAMADAGRGGILNVSSMAGFTATPGGATYSATKAFVTSLSESLHAELRPHGVHVCALCPGFTRTEFQSRAAYDTSTIPEAAWQTADEVAMAGLRGVGKNRPIVVPGVLNKVGVGMLNALPARLRRRVVARLAD